MAAAKRGQAPFAGTARRVLRANGACPLFVLCENQSAETVQLGAEQIVRPVLAAGVRRRLCPPDPEGGISEMPAPDEQLAGAWLKSMGPEITEGRLIAIGSGKDIEPSGAASPAEKGRTGGAQPPFRGRDGRGGANFTARQLFEVNDVALDTALVQGWFVAQGRVSAIRFNGQTLNGLVKGLGPGNGNGGFVVGSDWCNGLIRWRSTLARQRRRARRTTA